MASLIVPAGIFIYERVQKTRTKRKARKAETAARFSELEKDNAERMSRLQNHCSQGQQQEVVVERSRERGEEREGEGEEGERRSRDRRRNSFVEEGPPPPGYEEAMRDRAGRGGR